PRSRFAAIFRRKSSLCDPCAAPPVGEHRTSPALRSAPTDGILDGDSSGSVVFPENFIARSDRDRVKSRPRFTHLSRLSHATQQRWLKVPCPSPLSFRLSLT